MAEQRALAIYENGVFRILEPELLDLQEGQEVSLTIRILDHADFIIALAEQVYAGLSEEEIEAIEATFSRPPVAHPSKSAKLKESTKPARN